MREVYKINKITFITWIKHSNLTNKLESVKLGMYFYTSVRMTILKKPIDANFETTP